MPGGRPQGAIVSKLKLPASVQAVRPGEQREETMHSKLRPTRPEMPADLPQNLHGLWEKLVGELDDAGLIAAVDGPTLELALRHYAAAVQASDELIDGTATMHDDKNDRWMKNPASQVFRDHSTAFLEFAKQLGLSFTARARTTVAKEADDAGRNPFAVNS